MKLSNFDKQGIRESALVGAIGFAIMFLLSVFGFVRGWNDVGLFGITTAIIVLGLAAARRKYIASLRERIEGADDVTWDVVLNGVNVGTILDSKLAAIRLRVFRDARVYVAQIMNLYKVAVRIVGYVFLSIPFWLFWIVAALAAFAPDTFMSIVSEVQKSGPSSIASEVRRAVLLAGISALLVIGIKFAVLGTSDSPFGFMNQFAQANGEAIRKHCGAAAEGKILLVRYDNGGAHFNFQ